MILDHLNKHFCRKGLKSLTAAKLKDAQTFEFRVFGGLFVFSCFLSEGRWAEVTEAPPSSQRTRCPPSVQVGSDSGSERCEQGGESDFLDRMTSCLLRHSDPEGHASHGLVPLVVVPQVCPLQLTLHRQLGVVVPPGQEQLDGHHRLDVVGLEETLAVSG